jgi:anhydro-N-acetylmuramic acid kinase
MLAIGLMSGTSLDGVDAALVDISEKSVKLISFITHPFSLNTKQRILKCLSKDTSNVQEICSLNFELGHVFCEAIDALLSKAKMNYEDISFIASHGQTIWHNPNNLDGYISSTLQIGEAAVIAYHTNVDVISNFRPMDMAAGGMGAPLVPFADYYLFKSDAKNIALQNIGGIGNVTYLTKSCQLDDVYAFDTGPGNVLIDTAMRLLYNQEYDHNGNIASSGQIIETLLKELMDDPYIIASPPKTTGREKYTTEFVKSMIRKYEIGIKYTKEDFITTLSEFTVTSIITNYHLYLPNIEQIIVSGGGSHNEYIMKRLKSLFGHIVVTADEIGFTSDAKEAIAFVILGYRTLQGLPSNVIKATGAKEYCILGQITKAPIGRQ